MCAIIQVVGSWGRYFALAYTESFTNVLIAQCFIAISQPFFSNGVSKLASVWFADDERALATTIGSLSIPLGCIMGMVLGPVFIPEIDKYQHENGKEDITFYLMISAIACTLLSIWCILFFREKPNKYPSRSAMTRS